MISFIVEKQSCWDRLKAEKRPIFIYGMGDGALKIMSVFKQRNITVSGIFASDDFVRGHSFEGFKVHKLSEIEEMVNDFDCSACFCGQVIRKSLTKYKILLQDTHFMYLMFLLSAMDCLLMNTAWKMPKRYSRFMICSLTTIPEKSTPTS